tara:strand:- start:1384 stop:1566 length:183 start_codon:yes stop_codon:yes gene_type:complete
MKIKAKNGTLERIPGGLNRKLVKALMEGKEVSVDEVPHKLKDLVDVVENKQTFKKNKEVK